MLFKKSARFGTLVLAACSSLLMGCGSDGTPTTPTPAPSAVAPSSPAGAVTQVIVDESEFKLVLSQTTFKSGTYKFVAANTGQFPHNLIVNGPGVDNQKVPTGAPLKPGESTSLTVTLQAGTYEIYCGVPTHKDKGMSLQIQVV